LNENSPNATEYVCQTVAALQSFIKTVPFFALLCDAEIFLKEVNCIRKFCPVNSLKSRQ